MAKTVRIKAKEVLNDIKSGMHNLDLMRKYNLSQQSLESLFRKLESQGLLKSPDMRPDKTDMRSTANRATPPPVRNDSGSVNRNNALIEASLHGNPATVRTLLDQGANIDAKGSGGATALMMACWWGHLDVVRLLLDRGANVNAKGPDGYTALMEAARYGRFEITEMLLEKGADVNAKTVTGKTAHSLAKEKGNTELQELLLDYGAIE
jgi:ankyrin repeat protein